MDSSATDSTLSSHTSLVDEDDRKPAAAVGTMNNPLLMLGPDVMVSVLGFLDSKSTLEILTMPLCREWRLSYTADQDLWRTICCVDPFSADLPTGALAEASASRCDDAKNNCNGSSSSVLPDKSKDAFEQQMDVLGEYRLMYTSFVRCVKYLEKIENEGNEKKAESDKPPWKGFLSRFKSVIENNNGAVTEETMTPITVSGRSIQELTVSKKEKDDDDNSWKPKYADSMITNRLWGPSASGNLNLPKACAIYSIVNWMLTHPNVKGIQTMCIQSLPSLLEDEQQRIIGRKIGLVEVMLCAMLRFPDSVELHIAVFHAVVLLARPLGGREGMLFDNSMSETTSNIGLTSPVKFSDTVSSAAGEPPCSLENKTTKQHASSTHLDACKKESESTGKTGIAILVESMKRFSSSEKLQSMACWALVNVALVPLQKNMLMKVGGIEAILCAMERHVASYDVQFRALFALINLAVPCRRSDFIVADPNIDASEATRNEMIALRKLGRRITKLTTLAMKKFWSNEAILNRGCLVIHNLSQSSELMTTLLETPNCYQIVEWCTNHHPSIDKVLRRSVAGTLLRMQQYLDQHPDQRDRLLVSLEQQPNVETFGDEAANG